VWRWFIMLGVVTALSVLGAVVAPDAVQSNGTHGWLPWGMRGGLVASALSIVLLGMVAARGRRTWLGKTFAVLGVAAVVVAASVVLDLVATSADTFDQRSGLECGVTDNALGCHNSVYAGYAIGGAMLEAVVLAALALVAIAAAARGVFTRARRPAAP
jgi:hypothetical protein